MSSLQGEYATSGDVKQHCEATMRSNSAKQNTSKGEAQLFSYFDFCIFCILIWRPLGLCCIFVYSYLKTSWPLLHLFLFLFEDLLAAFAFAKWKANGASRQRLKIRTKWTFAPFALVAAAHLRCGCNLRKSKGEAQKRRKRGGSKWRPEAKANKNKNPRFHSR